MIEYKMKSSVKCIYEPDMNISVIKMKRLETLGSVFEIYVPKEGHNIKILCKDGDFKYHTLNTIGELIPIDHRDVITLKNKSVARFVNLNINEALKMRSNYRNPECYYFGESDHRYIDWFQLHLSGIIEI